MNALRQGLVYRLIARLNLRFPTLFLLFLLLSVVDFLIPDFIPFVDEIGFALLAVLFGLWKERRGVADGSEGGKRAALGP